MSAGDAIVRALGADPAVYRPLFRAHARILSRRSGLGRGGKRVITRGITPFQFRCFMYTVFSLIMLPWILGAASPIFGVALVLTVGAGFLLLDILFDKFDVLADADEYQVIAAHPHDAWSVLLAKTVAIGRSAAAIAACTFAIPAIGVGVAFHSVAAGLAFALAAAALSVAISAGGLLVSALVVATGGRRAVLRFLPAAHVAYLAIYFGVIAARETLSRVSLPQLDSLGWVQWAMPTVWFAAPVELVSGHAGPATAARGSLALGSFAVLLPLSARWVRTRFDERILEPVRAPVRREVRARAVARARSRGVPSGRSVGMRAFTRILVAHLRSDTAVRGGILMAFFMPALMMGTQLFGTRGSLKSEGVLSMAVTWIFLAAVFLVRTTVTSSRPAAIWFVLAAPRARVPFSRALETAVRMLVILPGVVAAGIYAVVAGTGPMWVRLAFVALVALLCDSGLTMLRVMSPELPFSIPPRSQKPFRWSSVLMGGGLLVGLLVLLVGFMVLTRISPVAGLVPVVFAAVARVGLGLWARRKVDTTAVAMEAS